MGYDSPLFQSALELFAHAIEHFNRGDERDRKSVILHLNLRLQVLSKENREILRNIRFLTNFLSCVQFIHMVYS